MLKMMAATGAAAITESAVGAQVKWSGGAERPKLMAPADTCDCHHHIYDVVYPTDGRGIAFPGDASIADYRALQRRLGIARHVVVQPSTYGIENAPTLDAVAAFGPTARAVVVVDTSVSDADLRRMHEQGARGIRFNLAQAGATVKELVLTIDIAPTILELAGAAPGVQIQGR